MGARHPRFFRLQGRRSWMGRVGTCPPTFLLDLYWKGTCAHPLFTTSGIIFGRAHPLWGSFRRPCTMYWRPCFWQPLWFVFSFIQGTAPSKPQHPGLKEATKSYLHLVWNKRLIDSEFILHMDDQISGHGFLPVYTGSDTSHIRYFYLFWKPIKL